MFGLELGPPALHLPIPIVPIILSPGQGSIWPLRFLTCSPIEV